MEPRCEATAKYAYEPQRDDELRLAKGDVVSVMDKSSDGWWKGEVSSSTTLQHIHLTYFS